MRPFSGQSLTEKVEHSVGLFGEPSFVAHCDLATSTVAALWIAAALRILHLIPLNVLEPLLPNYAYYDPFEESVGIASVRATSDIGSGA